MSQFDNTNTFVLFKNDKENDKQPDYTGSIELEDGKKLRLAAWIREGKRGKFMSGKVSEFQEKRPEPVLETAGDDSDLPF